MLRLYLTRARTHAAAVASRGSTVAHPVAVPDLCVEELEEEEQVVHVARASLQGQQPTHAQVHGFGSGQPAGRLAPLGAPEGRPAALQHAARQPCGGPEEQTTLKLASLACPGNKVTNGNKNETIVLSPERCSLWHPTCMKGLLNQP